MCSPRTTTTRGGNQLLGSKHKSPCINKLNMTIYWRVIINIVIKNMWLLPNNKTNSLLLFPIGPGSAHWRHYQVLTFLDMRCSDIWSQCPHLPPQLLFCSLNTPVPSLLLMQLFSNLLPLWIPFSGDSYTHSVNLRAHLLLQLYRRKNEFCCMSEYRESS